MRTESVTIGALRVPGEFILLTVLSERNGTHFLISSDYRGKDTQHYHRDSKDNRLEDSFIHFTLAKSQWNCCHCSLKQKLSSKEACSFF